MLHEYRSEVDRGLALGHPFSQRICEGEYAKGLVEHALFANSLREVVGNHLGISSTFFPRSGAQNHKKRGKKCRFRQIATFSIDIFEKDSSFF